MQEIFPQRATVNWDANGNLASRDATTYQWDFENRLTSITSVDGTVVETTYDAVGNRARAAVTPAGEPTRVVDYVVDTLRFLGHVVAIVAGGSVETLYTRADDQLIGLCRPTSEAARYYHADGLGSVPALSDETGPAVTVTWSHPFLSEGIIGELDL